MSDISKMTVGGATYDLKDATARASVNGVGTQLTAIGATCDQILAAVTGAVDAKLDAVNGETVAGGTLAKATAALAGVAAIRAAYTLRGYAVPYKLAELHTLVEETDDRIGAGGVEAFVTDSNIQVCAYAFYGHSLMNVNAPHVSKVGTKAFANCTDLATVDISGAADVAADCLDGCTGLVTLKLSNALDRLEFSFNGNENLTSVTGLGGVTFFTCGEEIETAAFAGCTALKKVDLSSACTELRSFLFCGCSSLEEVGDLSGVSVFPLDCFCDCSKLKSAFDLTNCTAVDEYAFWGCAELPFNEGSFHAPDLEFIGYGAFNGCSRLKEAYVYGCTDIDSEAFWGSSLEAIHFSTDEAYELEGFATRWGAGADVEVYVDL